MYLMQMIKISQIGFQIHLIYSEMYNEKFYYYLKINIVLGKGNKEIGNLYSMSQSLQPLIFHSFLLCPFTDQKSSKGSILIGGNGFNHSTLKSRLLLSAVKIFYNFDRFIPELSSPLSAPLSNTNKCPIKILPSLARAPPPQRIYIGRKPDIEIGVTDSKSESNRERMGCSRSSRCSTCIFNISLPLTVTCILHHPDRVVCLLKTSFRTSMESTDSLLVTLTNDTEVIAISCSFEYL